MKKTLVLVVCLLLSVFFVNAQNNAIDEELQKILNQRNDDYIDVNIMFKSQMPTDNLSSFYCKSDSKEVRREIVINELKKFSEQSQKDVMSVINAEERSSDVIDVKTHWIANFINCKAKRDVIYQLASHPDVALITYNTEMDTESMTSNDKTRAVQAGKIADHITQIKADKAWDLGYTGKGVVVAVLDSGTNFDHADIKDHLWNGNGKYGYNVHSPNSLPSDEGSNGHGSHCAGIVCGDGTSGQMTGVAPDATLMTIKIIGGGRCTAANLVEGVEKAAELGADIISLSVGRENPDENRALFRQTFTNLLNDFGIAAAVACGNDGNSSTNPAPDNVRTPGDCPPPWISPDQQVNAGGLTSVISVGAVNENNVVSPSSSKGPVTWKNISGFKDYAYNPGIGLIRPDIAAPGENVYSIRHDANNTYWGKSGTSQAAPCVAGVMALMLEKNPNLTPADLCRIIETTAVKLTTTKSNSTGAGLIDALAAVQAVDFNTSSPYLNPYAFTKTFNTGSNVNLELTLINNGKGSTSGNTSVTISENDAYTTIIEGNKTYSAMAAGATATATFVVNFSTLAPDNHEVTFTVEATNGSYSRTFEIVVNINNEFVAPSLNAQANGRDINLTWNATNNATSYNIYRNGELIANTTSTSYTDAGLDYGTLYAYTVTSKRGELESEHSLIARAQTMDNPDKPSPTNVKANNGSITWTNGTGSKNSNIYRKDVNTNVETNIATNVNGTTYTDGNWNSLADGVYQYGVSNLYVQNETVYTENFTNLSVTNSTSIYPTMNAYWYIYKEGSGNNYSWKIASSITNVGKTYESFSGNAAFITSNYSSSSYLSYLVTRPMDYTQYNGNDVKLSFYYITPAWKTDINTDINTLKVMISTTSYNSGWTELWSSNKTDVSEWTKAEVDLSDYVGQQFYIAFVNVAGYGYCTGVEEVSINVEGSSESRIEWSENIYKGVNIFVNDGDWSNTDNWAAKRLPNETEKVIIDANATVTSGNITVNSLTINEGKSLTLNNGTTLTVNGDFTNTDVDAFIINDGAQVFQNNEDVSATFVMNISNPEKWTSNNKDGWQFIASPMKDAKVENFVPTSSKYDLYKYDGTKVLEWRNHKDENAGDEEEPVMPDVPDFCNVIFTLKDSGDDGWNGNYLVVSYDKTSETLELESGSITTYTLAIPHGSNVTVTYTKGTSLYTYPTENSFTITYESGKEILSVDKGILTATTSYNPFTVDCTPTAPEDLVVTTSVNNESAITLTMSALGADSYTIYQGETLVAEGITTTTYTVEGLTADTEYCFTVVAINNVGTSESVEVCAKTKAIGLQSVTVQIGNGTNYTYSSPIYNFYSSKSISQTIYTAKEIGTSAGTITSISFNKYNGNNNTRNIAVYLKNTDKDCFTTTTDWEVLSENLCVYNDSFEFGTNGWVKINLQKSFSYEGGNLLVCIIDKTGSSLWSGMDYFYVYDTGQGTTDARAIFAYGSNIEQDLQKITANTGVFLKSGSTYRAPQIKLGLEISSAKTTNLNGGFDNVNSFTSSGVELSNFETTFQQGVGYLASYESETTATFKGTLNHEKSYTFDVSYNSGKDLANFHLLGNPFSFNMNWNNVSTSNMINGYAVVNNEGGYDYHTSGEIKVGDGFFVKATGANPSISYNARSRNDKKETSLNVIATGKDGKDNVIVRLDEEQEGFPKINNFNEDIALVYVSENDVPYGIYNYNDDVQEVELFFRAAHIGEYNIHIEPNGEFEYITLVDNVNGSETNMMTSSYSFTATPKENGKRFSLKFARGNGADVQENFVYQSGSELVIKAEGTVQIIDMMGRVIYNNDVTSNNRIDISKFNKTAYIVRLINGNGVNTQKIVVY